MSITASYAHLTGRLRGDLDNVEQEITSALFWLERGDLKRVKLHLDMAIQQAKAGQIREVEVEAA